MCVKKSFLAAVKSVAFVVVATTSVATLTSVVAPSAFAAEKLTLSQKVGKPLSEARELMGQKKLKEALDKINEAAAVTPKTAQEDQVINEFKISILGQMKDTLGAAKVIETMLAANQVPAAQIPERLHLLIQIYFQQKDYPKTIQYGERYIKEVGSTAEVLDIVTRSYYLKGDYKTSVEYAQKQVKAAELAKKAPDKDLLVLLMSAQFKLDDTPGITSTLEILLAEYPTQDYWKNIFVYLKKENSYTERENIEIARLKKAVGVLDADGYVEMAELALAMTDPGDAKAALEGGIAAGVIQASERNTRLLNRAKTDAAQDLASLDATAKEAGSKGNGDALSKVGAAYLGHGQNEKAANTLQSAITKGGFAAIDEAYIRLGVANLNLGKKPEAIKAFKSVSEKSKLARLARLWIIYTQKQK